MVSEESVRQCLIEERSHLLIMMQENDTRGGFMNSEWAEYMYQASEYLREAIKLLDEAGRL